MARYEIGDRVGAVLSAANGKAKFFGYGTYQGEHVPPEDVRGPFGVRPHEIKLTNPKIVLDNGETVWGCECWWGDEKTVKEQLENTELEMISATEFRKGYNEESKALEQHHEEENNG